MSAPINQFAHRRKPLLTYCSSEASNQIVLLSLAHAGKPSGGGLQEKLAMSQIWLSLMVEGDVLPSDGGEPLTDWRIVVSPPLIIQNQLPVSGSYLVWEVPRVRES